MKQLIFLIAIILWSILQARRKAMREQQRKQAQENPAPLRTMREQREPAVLGPVTAEENKVEPERIDRSIVVPDQATQEARQKLDNIRRAKKKKREAAQEENVERIVKPMAPASDAAYETVASVRTRIPLDAESLRTFMVTREILGPPRYRKPHRPGVRNR